MYINLVVFNSCSIYDFVVRVRRFICLVVSLICFIDFIEANDSFYRIPSKGFMDATTEFNIISTLQMTYQHMVELVTSKTTYMVDMSELQQIFFSKIDELKIVDLKFFLTIDQWNTLV